MNLLGKILTFLILLTSVAFCVVAVIVVASHQNWKAVAEENRKTADRYRTARDAAQEQLAALEINAQKEKIFRATAIAQLNSQLAIVEERYSQSVSQLQSLSSQLNNATALLKEAQSRLVEQDGEVKTLLAQNSTLSNDLASQASRVAQILSQVEAAEVKKTQLNSQLESIMAEYNDLKKVADVLGVDKNTLVSQIPPDLNGRVTSISTVQRNVFAVSLGMDDGLREGHTIDVVRNGRHVGTAKVTSSLPNKAVAKFVEGMKNSSVEVGDEVTTILSKKMTTSLSLNN